MSEPCELSAVTARRLIGARKLSPVELLESCLKRIALTNPAINAMVAMDTTRAMTEAREAEAAVMCGENLGLLHGLPIGVKDLERTAGLRTTWGSELFKDHVPTEDAPHIVSIRAAGGIVLGKTNAPEFGAGGNTTNRVYGPTGNPFDPALTSAGSSGGSAAALAAGQVPLATGSDYGGSIRTPAAFCGVVGFRPSASLVPYTDRLTGLMPWAVLGPMGRSLADAHLLLRAEVDIDRRDVFSRGDRRSVPDALMPADLGALRVAISVDLGQAPVDHAIKQTFLKKMKRLAGHFHGIEEKSPDFSGVLDVYEVFRAIIFYAQHAEKVEKYPDLVGPNVTDDVARAARFTLPDIARAHVEQTKLTKRFQTFFDDFDVLIAPAASVSPFDKRTLFVKSINGNEMSTYTRWLSITNFPSMALAAAVALPAGLDDQGLPFGIQLLGPRGSDAQLLDIAAAVEQALNSDNELARPLPNIANLDMRVQEAR